MGMVYLNGLQVQKIIGQGHNGIKMRSLEMIICLTFLAIKIQLVQFAESLRYECFANNTIQVYNPKPSVFVDVTANNSISKCITTWHDDTQKDIVKITECSKNDHILIGFSSKPFSFIQGGRSASFAYFSIFCNEIPKVGVEKVVHNGATAIIPTKVAGSVTPHFALMGHLYADNKKSTAVSSAHLGTQLYWVIQGPEMYSLLPYMCKAYSGLDANGDILQIIIFSGCSQNKDLVSDFTVVGSGEVSADLYTFRFHHSPFLTLVCDVLVCPIGSHACHYKCARGFRQIPRDVPDELEDNGTTTETVVTHLTIETDIESNFASASKGCITTVKFVTSALLLQRAFYYAYVIIS